MSLIYSGHLFFAIAVIILESIKIKCTAVNSALYTDEGQNWFLSSASSANWVRQSPLIKISYRSSSSLFYCFLKFHKIYFCIRFDWYKAARQTDLVLLWSCEWSERKEDAQNCGLFWPFFQDLLKWLKRLTQLVMERIKLHLNCDYQLSSR